MLNSASVWSSALRAMSAFAPVHPSGRPRLRHHDNRREAAGEAADRTADADLGLNETIGAALAAAVEKEHHWPGARWCVVPGDVDLVAVRLTGNRDSAVQKSGGGVLGRRLRRHTPDEKDQREEKGGQG